MNAKKRVRYDENALIYSNGNSGSEVPVTDNNVKVSDVYFEADLNNVGTTFAAAPKINGKPLYPGTWWSPDPKEGEIIVSKFVVTVPTAGNIVYVIRKFDLD